MVCSFHIIQYSRGNGNTASDALIEGSSLSHSTYWTVHCTHTHNGLHTRTVLIIHQGRKEGRGQGPDGGDGEQGRCSAGAWWDNLSACDEIQLRPSALQNSNTGNFLFAACKNREKIFFKKRENNTAVGEHLTFSGALSQRVLRGRQVKLRCCD